MNWAHLWSLAGLLALPGGAVANAPVAGALEHLLGRFEGLPDAATFRAHVTDPVEALLALHGSPTTPTWMRLRCYDALGRFPEARVQRFLEQTLDSALASAMVAGPLGTQVAGPLGTQVAGPLGTQAAGPLGNQPAGPDAHAAVAVYLRTFPAAAQTRLMTLLTHPDPQLRITVARIALASPDSDLRLAIAAWISRTRDSAVLDVLRPAPARLR